MDNLQKIVFPLKTFNNFAFLKNLTGCSAAR